jgi:hypothetical protein
MLKYRAYSSSAFKNSSNAGADMNHKDWEKREEIGIGTASLLLISASSTRHGIKKKQRKKNS